MTHDITSEEFRRMADHNENFNGKSTNFSKLALYQEIKAEFGDKCYKSNKLMS